MVKREVDREGCSSTRAWELALVLLASCGGDLAASTPVVVSVAMAAPAHVAGDPPALSGESAGMAHVPAGPFLRGCSTADDACYANEGPRRSIDLAAFYIDRSEVTVAAYRACVTAGGCSDDGLTSRNPERTTQNAPSTGENTTAFDPLAASATCNWTASGRSRHPMNCVSWDQARAFCGWAGKRLPSEAEWEKAARGTDERIYPWGDSPPTCELAVMNEGGAGCGAHTTAPVGSRPRGHSPYGAVDLIGNVCEWVADWYQEDYYAQSPDVSPPGPSGGRFRVVRGGTWRIGVTGGVNGLRISNRYSYVPQAHLDHVGFRCARDAR